MGKPTVIDSDPDSDPDSSLLAPEMGNFLKNRGVDLITTREHAGIAERTTRTINAELDKREKHEPNNWLEYLPKC